MMVLTDRLWPTMPCYAMLPTDIDQGVLHPGLMPSARLTIITAVAKWSPTVDWGDAAVNPNESQEEGTTATTVILPYLYSVQVCLITLSSVASHCHVSDICYHHFLAATMTSLELPVTRRNLCQILHKENQQCPVGDSWSANTTCVYPSTVDIMISRKPSMSYYHDISAHLSCPRARWPPPAIPDQHGQHVANSRPLICVTETRRSIITVKEAKAQLIKSSKVLDRVES